MKFKNALVNKFKDNFYVKISEFDFFRLFLFFGLSYLLLLLTTNLFFNSFIGVKIEIDSRPYFHLLDDPMINFRASYNFWLNGNPYINPEESVSAISTLFWPIIISPIYSLVTYEYAIVVFYLLSILIYSLTICLICNNEKNNFKAILKALLLILTPASQTYASSFWEHVPQALLVTLAFILIYNDFKKYKFLKISNLSFLILCSSFIFRPDSAPIIFVIGIYWTITNFFPKGYFQFNLLSFLTGLICLAFLASHIYGMLYFFSDIKPNTAYLKILSFKDSFLLGIKYLFDPLSSNYWLPIFLFICIFYSKFNLAQKLIIKCLIAQIVYIIYVGGDIFVNSRFFIFLIPILVVLFFDFLDILFKKFHKKAINQKMYIVIVAVILVAQYLNPTNLKNYLLYKSNGSLKNQESSIRSQIILADKIKKNLEPSDGSIGLHYLGISYHLPDFHVVDFLGKANEHIAKSNYKNLSIGHNKWDYSYSFENFNIAVVPLYYWNYETALNRSKTGNFVGDKEGFWNAAAEYIIKTGEYTFIYPNELNIKKNLSLGLFVRNDLISKIKK